MAQPAAFATYRSHATLLAALLDKPDIYAPPAGAARIYGLPDFSDDLRSQCGEARPVNHVSEATTNAAKHYGIASSFGGGPEYQLAGRGKFPEVEKPGRGDAVAGHRAGAAESVIRRNLRAAGKACR